MLYRISTRGRQEPEQFALLEFTADEVTARAVFLDMALRAGATPWDAYFIYLCEVVPAFDGVPTAYRPVASTTSTPPPGAKWVYLDHGGKDCNLRVRVALWEGDTPYLQWQEWRGGFDFEDIPGGRMGALEALAIKLLVEVAS